MSQQNAKIVRAIYDAINRDDWDAAFRDAHPDFELTFERSLAAGTHRGRQQVQPVLQDQWSAFDIRVLEPEQVVESGDQVAVIVRTRVRPRGSSAELEVRNGHLWTISNGTVVSMHSFPEPERALEAVGLSNQDARAGSS
jgi:ketosteroid isomerase-like protein